MYRDMKRLLLLFTLMATLFVGCNKTEEEPCYLEIDRESVSISAEGGSVDVVIRTNRKWQITSDSDWCLPSVTSGKACKDGVAITFSAELTYASREAEFVITAADRSVTIVVSQEQKDNMVLEGEESFTLSSDGGRVTLAALANVECEVIVPSVSSSLVSVVASDVVVSSVVVVSSSEPQPASMDRHIEAAKRVTNSFFMFFLPPY